MSNQTSTEHTPTPPAAVIIPAHDEAGVIATCLAAIAADEVGRSCEVVVAANGCTDQTVAIARGFADRLPLLRVLDLPTPSKVAALNAGDAAATAGPRIYLDADIELSPGALAHLVETLQDDEAVVASPSISFDLDGADLVVREFYRMFAALPYVREGLIGLGVYGLSAAGRARFGEFPELTADDLFVQRLFSAGERRTSQGSFTVRVPRTAQALLKVRTRVARGNAELATSATAAPDEAPATLDASSSTGGTVRSLVEQTRRQPTLLPAAATYVGVTALARRRARQAGAGTAWERDDSTRPATTTAQEGSMTSTNASGNGVTRVAYLVSQYPAVSHVFIEREVLGLREQGVEVHTFSVRKPDEASLISEVMRAEAANTFVLQGSRTTLARANATLGSRHLAAYAKALGRALRTGEAGLRQRTWQGLYLAEAASLYEEMSRRGLRHVHAHFANNGADIARLTVELGRAIDGPDAGWAWSFSMHGPTEFEEVTAFDLAAKTREADGVACITDFTRSQLMRLVDPAVWPKLGIVHMSVVPESFPPPASREHGGPLRILDVGRLVPEKGGPVLVDAVEMLRERGVDVEVHMVGAGPLMEPLRASIAARGLDDRITLTGNKSQDEILQEYHWADVFVLPSFQEGLPVVIMEALSTELPVVATRINGIGELVVDEVTGRLLTPGRADLVADAVADLAADPEKRRRLGAAGRQAVLDAYTTASTSKAQRDFLQQVQARVAR